jgi:hypothetical protein
VDANCRADSGVTEIWEEERGLGGERIRRRESGPGHVTILCVFAPLGLLGSWSTSSISVHRNSAGSSDFEGGKGR